MMMMMTLLVELRHPQLQTVIGAFMRELTFKMFVEDDLNTRFICSTSEIMMHRRDK